MTPNTKWKTMASSSTSAHPTLAGSPLFEDIVRRLTAGGIESPTASSAVTWLVKSLHPAWSGTCGPIPDSAQAAVILPDYTVQMTVSCPTGVTADWDFCIIQPPGDCTAAVALAGVAGVNFATTGISANNGADGGLVVQTLATQPLIAAQTASTAVLSDIAYNVNPTAAGAFIVRATGLYSAVRRRYASLTVYPVASSLYDQGTIYAGSFSRPVNIDTMTEQLYGYSGSAYLPLAANNTAMFRRAYVDLPLSEANMAMLDPQSVGWPFRNGAYIPARYTNPSIDFAPMSFGGSAFRFFGRNGTGRDNSIAMAGYGAQVPGYVPTLFQPLSAIGAFSTSQVAVVFDIESLVIANPAAAPFVDAWDTALMSCSTGVVIGRGLATQASVTVRVHMGLEYIPQENSPVLQFTKPAALPSMKVVEMYHVALAELNRTVYPSSWNSFGTILNAIGSAVKAAVPMVTKLVPFAAPVLEAVGLSRKKGGSGGGGAPQLVLLMPPKYPPADLKHPLHALGLRRASASLRLWLSCLPWREKERQRLASGRPGKDSPASETHPHAVLMQGCR